MKKITYTLLMILGFIVPVEMNGEESISITEKEDPENPVVPFVPTLREDRVWRYRYNGGKLIDGIYEQDIILECHFEKMEVEDDIIYVWKTEDITTCDDSKKREYEDYYLYENNGLVFLYMLKPEMLSQGSYVDEYKDNHPFMCMFNFTSEVGKSYYSYRICDEWIAAVTEVYTIIAKEYVEIDGELCRKITVEGNNYSYNWKEKPMFSYIEGIGIDFNSEHRVIFQDYMPWIDTSDPTSLIHTPYDVAYRRDLIGVYDKDGRMIFKGTASLPPVDGIEETYDDTSHSTSYFNLYGQRVEHPVKGKVYIERSGSKSRKVIY